MRSSYHTLESVSQEVQMQRGVLIPSWLSLEISLEGITETEVNEQHPDICILTFQVDQGRVKRGRDGILC